MTELRDGKNKVSVVVSAYNSETTISRALKSIDKSADFELEIIVIDDASADSTFSICDQLKNYLPIRIFKNESNCGAGFSRDFAINQVNSKYIAILDSDDYCINNRISKQFNYLEENPSIDLVSSQMIYFGPWGQAQNPTKYPSSGENIVKKLGDWKMPIAHGASMFRRDWYLSTNGYSHMLRLSEDLDLFRQGISHNNFHLIDEPLIMCYTASKIRSFKYVSQFTKNRVKLQLQDPQIIGYRRFLLKIVIGSKSIGYIYQVFGYFKYLLSSIRR